MIYLIYYFMLINFCLHLCLYTMFMLCQIEAPDPMGCGQPFRDRELNLGLLKKRCVLLNTKPSLKASNLSINSL